MVKIEVHQDVKKNSRFDFEKEIKNSLSIIPSQHLVGLDKIMVVYYSPFNKGILKNALGMYYGKREGAQFPHILICANPILNLTPQRIPILNDMIFRLNLRKTLYHEIGHHFQRITNGIYQEIWEANADQYSVRMQLKKYKENFIGRIFIGTVSLLKTILNLFRRMKERKIKKRI